MNACREFRDLLSAHLDGALDPAGARALEAHLAGCAACARALEDLRAAVARVRALEPVEPPPWLAERILARVAPAPRSRFRVLAGRPELQAAALVLVCFTGYLVMRLAGPSRGILPPPLPRGSEPSPARPAETPGLPSTLPAAPAPGSRAPGSKPAPAPARKKELREEAKAEAAPPAQVEQAQGLLLSRAVAGRARKAEARDAAANAPVHLDFRMEARDAAEAEPAVLEALRLCGAQRLTRRERMASARLESRALPALRALLERAGRVGGSIPPDLPAEVVVTISW